MNRSPSQPARHLAHELLAYWIAHPEAQSTLEAIVEWWLLEQRIQNAAEDVRVVLQMLLANGFVVQRQQADGRTCYRLNVHKTAEICAWLNSGGGRSLSTPGKVLDP